MTSSMYTAEAFRLGQGIDAARIMYHVSETNLSGSVILQWQPLEAGQEFVPLSPHSNFMHLPTFSF